MANVSEIWKERVIWMLSTLVVAGFTWLANDFLSTRDKIQRLPEPSQIAWRSDVQQDFKLLNDRIDGNDTRTQARLDRIETKLDNLVLALATHDRAMRRMSSASQGPVTSTPDSDTEYVAEEPRKSSVVRKQ
jgi:hypothetical protein